MYMNRVEMKVQMCHFCNKVYRQRRIYHENYKNSMYSDVCPYCGKRNDYVRGCLIENVKK